MHLTFYGLVQVSEEQIVLQEVRHEMTTLIKVEISESNILFYIVSMMHSGLLRTQRER